MEQQQRPRSKSTFSFKSHKSQKSPEKHQRTASHEEKHSHFPRTKADPNAAMNEEQPVAAALEKPTLQSLSEFEHNDIDGNPIPEPDLSNPTRSRWERPLDTIRSFEAAIDREYRRRGHAGRRDAGPEVCYASCRSSYYRGHDHYQHRYSQASCYYNNRQAARDSYVDSGHGMGGPVGGPPRTRLNRIQSEPGWSRYHSHAVYPTQGYQKSRDTVHTNGSNGSHSDPYSTDPNSENSSMERSTPITRPDRREQYGFQGFGGGPIIEGYKAGPGPIKGYGRQQPNGNGMTAPVPVTAGAPPPPIHHPIKLGQSTVALPANGKSVTNGLKRQGTEKRRSWFKRRFTKD